METACFLCAYFLWIVQTWMEYTYIASKNNLKNKQKHLHKITVIFCLWTISSHWFIMNSFTYLGILKEKSETGGSLGVESLLLGLFGLVILPWRARQSNMCLCENRHWASVSRKLGGKSSIADEICPPSKVTHPLLKQWAWFWGRWGVVSVNKRAPVSFWEHSWVRRVPLPLSDCRSVL